MGDQINPISLLSVARTVLRDELLKEVPSNKKYQALMVARAMAITEREQTLGSIATPSDEFVQSLEELMGLDGSSSGMLIELITQIRTGEFGADAQETANLHQLLVKETKRKLEVCNPEYLIQNSVDE